MQMSVSESQYKIISMSALVGLAQHLKQVKDYVRIPGPKSVSLGYPQ